MQIKKIILNNIRTYKHQEIEFQGKTILLSGDIGTGKTSILIAIEFAFFGFIKGSVDGSALLNHGSKNGGVEVEVEINNKIIVIKRNIKRTSRGIAQADCSLTIENQTIELTPQELRAKILEILGYPKEFITRSPALIYRYTVYTPQEDMKNILFDSPDSRIEIIRKIFNLDKYKLIISNVSMFLKELNAKLRLDKSKVENTDILKNKEKELKEKIKELKELSTNSEIKIKKKKEILEKLNIEISKISKDIKYQNNVKRKIDISKTKLDSMKKRIDSDNQIIYSLKKELSDGLDIEIPDIEEFKLKIQKLKETKSQILNKNNEMISKKGILDSRIKESQKIIDNISSLEICPKCGQDVSEEYKKKIFDKESEKINSMKEKQVKINNNILIITEKLNNTDKEIEKYLKIIRDADIKKLKLKSINEKKLRIKTYEKEIKEYSEQINLENDNISKYSKEINIEISKLFEDKSLEFKNENNTLRSLEIEFAGVKKDMTNFTERLEEIQENIKEKSEIQKSIKENMVLRDWLDSFFIGLMEKMEKHTISNILKECNEYFQEWFNILIEDDNLNVRLDDLFTPLIEQNGYDTSIQNLSGGEKTSVALAYRLSLNKVINNFMSTINTKNFLILDEPTDGFSSEQMDRIREVLERLNMSQIILVSHEPKLESYADSIIKVRKENNISSI